ncbi:uncharacterized protein LOC109852612 isoform X2 [Pseudomyrmex gracilis]|uniref:uncharacterized protein LOC109852612 isoform X2 n=1 Tax=Pseudomyrmex gracilis TaxID=219809 RepID=UPI000995472A|nr:uncharacterized protein LOC109852612 isoform X2 [Pseudomyrmex gracilis]
MALCKEESILQNVKEKLLALDCPFTWEIVDAVIKHKIMRPNTDDDEIDDSGPLEHFIICLLNCYKAVLSADDDSAKASIENAEQFLMVIQQQKNLNQIIRAIEHVFYATKCFYLFETHYMEDTTALTILEILENITDIKDMNSVELGGLYGCGSVTWSCFNDYGMEKAIDLGKRAVEKNEDCALWHFILAKNLRRKRRSVNLSDEVSYMEKTHFEIAYAMTKNHVFGIYYLQMRLESFYKFSRDRNYKEKKSNNEKQVLELAVEMFKTNPTSYKVLLKLARIFTTVEVEDYRHYAIMCLNAVDKITPNNSTTFHYYAMIYRQSGDYREAIKYYKKAAERYNFVCELSYVEYGWEVGELEPLPHLLQMDIPAAGKYFLRALEIDPQHKKFKIYYRFLDFSTQSLSSFFEKELCPHLLQKKCDETCNKIKDLLNPELNRLTKELDLLTVCSSTNTSDTN